MYRSTIIVLAFLAAFTYSPSSRAGTEVFAYIINPIGGNVETIRSTKGPFALSRYGSDARGFGWSRSSVGLGYLRVFAQGHAVNSGNASQNIGGGAQAYFRDDLTINAAGLTGSNGTLAVKFKLDGSLTCSGGGDSARASSADCRFSFYKNGSLLVEGHYLRYFNGATEGTNFLGQERTVLVPFTFGSPFELKLMIESTARAYNYRGADAVSDLEHTVTWGGFVSVKDGTNNDITNYTATAQSGVNYVVPIVPPPPKLLSRRLTPSELEITWPIYFSDYQLYSGTNFPASAWNPVQSSRITNESDITVTASITNDYRFFILKKP